MREWDLSSISKAMHGHGGTVDPQTGAVRVTVARDAAMDAATDGTVPIPVSGADADLRELEAFVSAVADPQTHTMLDGALASGAFRSAVIADRELERAWGRFQEAHRRGQAADWLEEKGLVDAPDAVRLRREAQAAERSALAVINADANAELRGVEALEEELQTPMRRRDEAWLQVILADDFEEVGATGRVYSRREALAALLDRTSPIVAVHDISSRRMGVDSVLVRWRSDVEGRVAARTSLWRMDPAGWRLAHHQATPVA